MATRRRPLRRFFRRRKRLVRAAAGAVGLALVGWGVTYGMPRLIDAFQDEPDPVVGRVEPTPASRSPVQPPPVDFGPGLARFAVDKVNYAGADGFGYVLPVKNVSAVGQPPHDRPSQWRAWAYDKGGADADVTDIQVTLVGQGKGTVLVNELRVDVVRRAPALEGIKVKGEIGGCGPGVVNEIWIDLDAQPPRILPVEGPKGPEAPELIWTLAPGEVEVFHLVASIGKGLVEWRLVIDLLVAGKPRTLKLDDGGRPFRTTSASQLPHFEWIGGRWRRSGPPC